MQEKDFITASHSAVCAVGLRLLRQGPLRYVHEPEMFYLMIERSFATLHLTAFYIVSQT